MWFEFSQNNSGGTFDVDDAAGIGVKVWIEANSAEEANDRAENIGLYFNGCESGLDCDCCGDRWYAKWRDESAEEPNIDPKYDFSWGRTVYFHKADGTILRAKLKNYKKVLASLASKKAA